MTNPGGSPESVSARWDRLEAHYQSITRLNGNSISETDFLNNA